MTARPLSLFEGYGIEIEAAVVDVESLDVRPVVDELLREAAGADGWVEDFEDDAPPGGIAWSNELVMHVVELKTNGPVPDLAGVAPRFLASIGRMDALLREHFGARLLPGGMHPWMDPTRETRLWPHDSGPFYRAYDRLFDCRRHGWANLQSVHLNLPFADDHELARLLAATRIVLPLVPALAAASPVMDGRATGWLDNRLDVYRTNSARVRSMTGDVVPEPIYDADQYREHVLGSIDRELEALGADEVLRHQEFTNARGAIVRFDRMAVEIRLIDAQECSLADLAVAGAVAGLVRAHVEERWIPHRDQRTWETAPLSALLRDVARTGPDTPLRDRHYRRAFGLEGSAGETAGALLRRTVESTFAGSTDLEPALQHMLRDGTLAQRILAALGPDFDRPRLRRVYGELADCLVAGRTFSA